MAAPSRLLPDTTVRHLPRICRVLDTPERNTHFWAAAPLQVEMVMRVPDAAELPGSVRHIPGTPEMTGAGGSTQNCPRLPLQARTPTRVPVAVLLPGSLRHRPVRGLASRPPDRSAHHWLDPPVQVPSTARVPLAPRHRPPIFSWPAPPGSPAGMYSHRWAAAPPRHPATTA